MCCVAVSEGLSSGSSSFVFDCCGVLPAARPAAVADGATAGWRVDSRGCYAVSSAQQLLSSQPYEAAVSHMYAIGDCCAGPVAATKLAYTAELQATVAAANVSQQLQSGAGDVDGGALLSFPLSLSGVLPAPSLVCCSLGAWDGVLVFNELVLGGWLAALAKLVIERSKVGQYRGELASVALWAVGEPMTFAVNRLYQGIARAWHYMTRQHVRSGHST